MRRWTGSSNTRYPQFGVKLRGVRRAELQAQRRAVGLSQEALAQRIGVSVNSVRNWERGSQTPFLRHHRPLAEALEVGLPQLNRLLDSNSPIQLDGHEVPGWLNTYESLVGAAGGLSVVAQSHIPALLQTKGYAAAIERYGPLVLTDEQVAQRVDVRLARQAVIHRESDPLRSVNLVAEHLLTETVNGPEVMAAQLDHLVELAERPNIELRILPADGRAACALGGFEMITRAGDHRPFMVVDFGIDSPRYVENSDLVATFVAMFDHLAGVALSSTETTRRIRDIRKSHQ
jgi:transcriptional regulator with XRE-family HTH domain